MRFCLVEKKRGIYLRFFCKKRCRYSKLGSLHGKKIVTLQYENVFYLFTIAMLKTTLSNKNFYAINGVLSTLLLGFLVWLIYFQEGSTAAGTMSQSILPAVNATLNSLAALLIVGGVIAIKQRREKTHRNFMISAFVCSVLFLLCYVYYHSQQGDTKFLGEGFIRPVYFFILISHIVLSAVMLPMIISTMFFGITNRRKSHKAIAKWTYPIWLYVSVTGVVVFFLLRAYS